MSFQLRQPNVADRLDPNHGARFATYISKESRSRPCCLDSISCVGWIAPGRAEIALFDTTVPQMWIFAGPGSGKSLGAMARGRCSVFRGRRATPAMARNDPEGQESPANEEPSLD
jgi:hypothetical protein